METTQRNSGRKLNLYNVTLVICIVMIIIFLIIIIPFSKDKDSQNNKIQIVESSVKSGEEITEEDYVLTNINLDGYYVIRLKNNKEYKIYKEGKRDYILKDNRKIYLDEQVRKWVLSDIREYERYGIWIKKK